MRGGPTAITLEANQQVHNSSWYLPSKRNSQLRGMTMTRLCSRIKICEAHTWWSKGIWTIWTPTANTCWLALAGSCCTRILVADMVNGMLRCVTSRLNILLPSTDYAFMSICTISLTVQSLSSTAMPVAHIMSDETSWNCSDAWIWRDDDSAGSTFLESEREREHSTIMAHAATRSVHAR